MSAFFRRTPQSTRPVQARLSLESLEERAVPATFTVINTADTGAGSLRQAIITANTTAGADIINFDPTVFTAGKTINLANANDFAGQNNGYTINDSVTINGPGVLNLTLNGAGNGGARIMTVDHTQAGDDGTASANAAAVTVVINNLTFAGGNITGIGAAVANVGDNVTLQTNHFENNNSTTDSGGAVSSQNGGTLTVRQSSFVNNTANGSGGAIASNAFGGSGMLTIENSTFSSNMSAGNGGAIALFNDVTATLTNNTISGNSAGPALGGGGGGVAIFSFGSPPLATLTGNIIFGNTVAGMANDVDTNNPAFVGAGSGFNDIGVYTNIGGAAAALTTGNNGNISANPMLGTLTTLANGTRAFAPAAGSPVLDTIAAGAPAVDQGNNARPAGSKSDMGSIERALFVGGGGGSTTTSPITPAQVATVVSTATTTPPVDPRVPLNAQVLANLRTVFDLQLPPNGPVAFAQVVTTSDLNGDGFADMLSVVALRVQVNGRPALRVFLLSFDGLSPNGALLPNGATELGTVPVQ